VLSLAFGFHAAARQARIAEANRERAERRFADARRLASSLVFEVHDAIEHLRGATAARALLLKRASEHLDALAADAPGDPELAEEVASAYHKLANVQGTQGTANLGDRQAALANHRKGLAIRKALAAEAPHDPERRARLVASLVFATYAEPEVAPSLEHARAAVVEAEALVAARPGEARFQGLLAQAHYAEGSQYRDIGESARALPSFEKAAPLYEQANAKDPRDGAALRGLALCQKRIGAILVDGDEPRKALPYLRRAVVLDEARLAQGKEVLGLRRDLSVSHTQLGFALLSAGEADAALASFEQALALRESIVRDDPRQADAPNDVASALWYIGKARIAQRRWDEARASLRRALPLAARPRNDRDDLLASVQSALADAHEGQGRLAEALLLRRESLDYRRRLFEAKPDVKTLRRGAARGALDLGATLGALAAREPRRRAEHARAARAAYEEGLRIAGPLGGEGAAGKRDAWLLRELREGLRRFEDAPPGRAQAAR
jgi:tetratricopeptide (TPR) repeat protein